MADDDPVMQYSAPSGGILRWEPPPPIRHGGTGEREVNWMLIAAQARGRAMTHPDLEDRWGVVRDGVTTGQASAWQARIVGGKTRFFAPAGAFEATIRIGPDDVRRLYIRYVGDLLPQQEEDTNAEP